MTLQVNRPSWLPEEINLDGDWNVAVNRLYQIFGQDVLRGGLTYKGISIELDRRKIDSPYEESFWHVITQTEQRSGDRLPDFRRAERLPWFAPIIRNVTAPEVKCWRNAEGKDRYAVYFWLEKFDYVIILELREKPGKPKRVALRTAYHVGGASTRGKLAQRWTNRTP